ncbi:MAG TPA: hypothetical protein VFH78_06775 [Candidatus Thermoplasmatota archaeon]|nr:hypothetical protein [Candidatus Thermoplasmatota archaeon]
MAWRHATDGASTSAVGLIIAAATFGVAFTAANLMVEKPAGMDHRATHLDSAAVTALEVIVSQPGRAANGAAWTVDPDLMDRFGLARAGQENFLDYVKIKAMRNGTMRHAENNAPDYEDVRLALGLTGGDFHLRTYPVIPSFEDPRWTKENHGRVAYIAHYDSPSGQLTLTSWANLTPNGRVNVTLAIRNDAPTPQIYLASVGIGNNATKAVIATDDRHTKLLQPGEVQSVSTVFPKMAFSPSVTAARIEVNDAYGNTLVQPYWLTTPAPTGTDQAWAPLLTAGSMYFRVGETVNFSADHYRGDGQRTSGSDGSRSAQLVLIGPSGSVLVNQSITLPRNGPYNFTCTSLCAAEGTYRAILWRTTTTGSTTTLHYNATDVVHVSSSALFQERGVISAVATKEREILASLSRGFNNRIYDATTDPDGDIFADTSHLRELPDLLSRYGTLVVGSEVKQNALNSAQIKWGIASWVQNGGNLIVLGTHKVQSRWLEPVYHAAQVNANGGIGTPDPTHPVLSTPNKLDYQRYLDRGRAWDINNGAPFTHVLSRGAGAGGNSMQDTLAIAAPGAYNDGTVVLTSYMPGSLTEPQDDLEAKRFLHNLLSQSYNMLFLDYGPPIPDKTPVGSAQRLVAVPHPSVPNAVVEVRIVMYTWS